MPSLLPDQGGPVPPPPYRRTDTAAFDTEAQIRKVTARCGRPNVSAAARIASLAR